MRAAHVHGPDALSCTCGFNAAHERIARTVPCTCHWNTGDHEDRCEMLRAWEDARDAFMDEVESEPEI